MFDDMLKLGFGSTFMNVPVAKKARTGYDGVNTFHDNETKIVNQFAVSPTIW